MEIIRPVDSRWISKRYQMFDWCKRCLDWFPKSDRKNCEICNSNLRKNPHKRSKSENVVRY